MSEEKFINESAATAINKDQIARHNQTDYVDYANKKKESKKQSLKHTFIAFDEKMLRIKEVIEQVKNTNISVLISGESGVGKEVIAQYIHEVSSRSANKFVAVNCAALPSNLLESELFGYEKGAFTGAFQQHIGKFEYANKGTLLLDEITEMDQNLQAKLLRVLQEKEIERIGGNQTLGVDVRVIATTNRNIEEFVKEKKFRQDLFYRLHVIDLKIPPLRKRKKDIPFLARYFLNNYASQYNRSITLSSDAIMKLENYYWPGNVRELQNVIQRIVVLNKTDVITKDDLQFSQSEKIIDDKWISHLPVGKYLRDVETQFILETLKSHDGNRTHAAKTLGISLRTLRNKINEYLTMGIEVMSPKSRRNL